MTHRTRLAAWSLVSLAWLAAPVSAATLQDIVNIYTGPWTNLTFVGSTGPAEVTIEITGSTLTATFSMGGNILGGFVQSSPIQLMGTIANDDATINQVLGGIYGQVTGTIHGSDGSFSFTLTSVANPNITSVDATGTIAGGHFDLAYIVHFVGMAVANGTLTAVPEPMGGVCGLAALAVLGILRARRRA